MSKLLNVSFPTAVTSEAGAFAFPTFHGGFCLTDEGGSRVTDL